MVTFREGGKQIRASVALFNNRSDVERFLGVLRAMA
jgi:selenocysteine lyase/cysteine desulfurase